MKGFKTMKINKLSVLFLLPLLVSCGGGAATGDIETYTPTLPEFVNKNQGAIKTDGTYDYLDIYEISDFHGAVQYNKSEKQLGLARLGTYFDKKRENNPGGTVILSGGDMWQGSADSNLTRGNLVTYSMDVIGFDAMTMGNHEFDWTKKWIQNNKEKATFPLLGANIYDKSTKQIHELYKPSTILNRGDYKIGVIGTIADNIRNSILASAIADVEFRNEVSIVTAEAARLKNEEKCDVVLWSSHRDATELYNLVTTDLGIDGIFGGHSHTTGDTFNEALDLAFLQSEPYGQSIPHLQLKINKSTKEVTTTIHEVDENPTANEYTEDKDIKSLIDQYSRDIIGTVKSQKLGSADGDLKIADTLSNFCVYSMKEEVKRTEELKNYDIVASFHNRNGGVRKDIAAGNITYGQVYESFPFDNEIVILKITGRTLSTMFFKFGGNWATWQKFGYDPVEQDKEYYVLCSDFMESNEAFFKGHGGEVINTGLVIREAVANQIRIMKNIETKNFKASKSEYQLP